MTDARFPDRWLSDRRVVRLSDGAFRLFVTSLAWSASNRTDGYLDVHDLALIHGVDASKAAELVAATLWKPAGEGWQSVEFTNTQTTAAQLEGLDHKRRQDRDRKARQRARDRGQTDPEPPPQEEDASRVTSTVTSDVTHRQGKDRQGKASSTEPTTSRVQEYQGGPVPWERTSA